MISKSIFLILIVIFYGLFLQVNGDDDDDCGTELDLSLYYRFDFTGSDIYLLWELNSQTNCSVLYHLIIQDSDLGIIHNEYLQDKSARLEGISPCVLYHIELKAINEAIPTMEGPAITMGIVFSKKVQKAPSLGSLDVQSTSINITWNLEGDSNRCPLINLYIDGGSYFNQTVSLQDLTDGKTVPVEITSLRPNSMYFFKVYVENNAGMSPPMQLAVQTLESTDRLNEERPNNGN